MDNHRRRSKTQTFSFRRRNPLKMFFVHRFSSLLIAFLLFLSLGKSSVSRALASPQSECEPKSHQRDSSAIEQAPEKFAVTFLTTASETPIVVEVYRDWAPRGVDRFYNLILDNYYNCASFFRVVPNFVVQFGIAAEPNETEKWSAEIKDDPVTQSNRQGTLSFATAGPNTRTTQVFVNLEDNKRLDSMGFSPFGKVVAGLEVLVEIRNPTPASSNGIDQGKLKEGGNDWLLKEYPDVDMILSTEHTGTDL